jgi:UDP:flavonoid glycosyltransferase YjiC (YdhE family)
MMGRVSHAALFFHCAAAVHHGGAGTTHTALTAGVPSIVVPHVADQFFWTDELQRIGVALNRFRAGRSVDRLADRIRATSSTSNCASALETWRRRFVPKTGSHAPWNL